MHTRNILTTLLILFLIQGCGGTPFWLPKPHKIEIQQGNLLDEEQISAVSIGTSREQVVRVLGAPVLESLYNEDRWDYVYAKGPAGEKKTFKSLIIYFENDVVTRMEGDYGT